MIGRNLSIRNIVIVSVVILATAFAAFLIISRHNEEHNHNRGVFVINELCKP